MSNRLFEPTTIGNLQLRNRLIMPAMVTQYGDKSGFVTERLIDHYVERARNDLALVIVEATCVAPGGRFASNQLNIYSDAFVPKLAKLAESIKEAGARAFLQLMHSGRRAKAAANDGIQPLAPSAIPEWTGEMPRELAIDEIDGIIEAFAEGAKRAKESGFDGVEVHFGHSYLIHQFLSPLTNKRNDKYGGDLEARARISLEIVERTRQRVGEKYPLVCRITGDEGLKGGRTLKDTQRVVRLLEPAGIDAFSVSTGYSASHEEGYLNTTFPTSTAPMPIPHGCYLHLAEGIKKVISVPVIAVGRLNDPDVAEKAIVERKADLIAIGRGLLADAAFASKVYHHEYGNIRTCIACNVCTQTLMAETNVRCALNAELGREREYQIKATPKPKRIIVVGGGPGGMEAARIAALRGHRVTLTEQKAYLGGNMVPAAAASFKHDIRYATEYLSNAIYNAGVQVNLNITLDEDKILASRPDVVILATGALPETPAIPGIDRKNVAYAVEVLEGKVETGSKVVVAGAGAVGCEVAVYLCEQGKEVTIVDMIDTDFSNRGGLAHDMVPSLRKWLLFEIWPNLSIEVIGKSTFVEVNSQGLKVRNREGGQKLLVGQTIIFAAGMKANNSLKERLVGKVQELYELGDCVKPRRILDAISEAANIARLI